MTSFMGLIQGFLIVFLAVLSWGHITMAKVLKFTRMTIVTKGMVMGLLSW